MPIKYVGRVHDFKGKTLWEILGNLKDFGVGRMVIRNRFQRYPEPTFMRILKVRALPNPTAKVDDDRKITVLVERTFRGRLVPSPVQMEGTTYKSDYILIPKDEEGDYIKSKTPPKENTTVLPRTMPFPPVFKEILVRQMKANKISVIEEPRLLIRYNPEQLKRYNVAKEGETPTVEFNPDHPGTPVSNYLYAHTKPVS